MVVGEPQLFICGDFGKEDERHIVRLRNSQYDLAAQGPPPPSGPPLSPGNQGGPFGGPPGLPRTPPLIYNGPRGFGPPPGPKMETVIAKLMKKNLNKNFGGKKNKSTNGSEEDNSLTSE